MPRGKGRPGGKKNIKTEKPKVGLNNLMKKISKQQKAASKKYLQSTSMSEMLKNRKKK